MSPLRGRGFAAQQSLPSVIFMPSSLSVVTFAEPKSPVKLHFSQVSRIRFSDWFRGLVCNKEVTFSLYREKRVWNNLQYSQFMTANNWIEREWHVSVCLSVCAWGIRRESMPPLKCLVWRWKSIFTFSTLKVRHKFKYSHNCPKMQTSDNSCEQKFIALLWFWLRPRSMRVCFTPPQ